MYWTLGFILAFVAGIFVSPKPEKYVETQLFFFFSFLEDEQWVELRECPGNNERAAQSLYLLFIGFWVVFRIDSVPFIHTATGFGEKILSGHRWRTRN